MLTTTKNGLTYCKGSLLGTQILTQGIDREQARDAYKGEMERIWREKGYVLPAKDKKCWQGGNTKECDCPDCGRSLVGFGAPAVGLCGLTAYRG